MIKTHMTDLPTPQRAGDFPASKPSAAPIMSEGTGSKEKEAGFGIPESPLAVVGKEVDVSKEVASVGVHVQPTTIPLPDTLERAGVKPSGTNVPSPDVATIHLPITDKEIAEGLHRNLTDSMRWLAEFCKLQLLKVGIKI